MTPSEQKFVEVFDGNVEQAAKATGLPVEDCRALATRFDILDRIRNRELEKLKKEGRIATKTERMEFWTRAMRGELQIAPDNGATVPVGISDRIKASELLGKAEADFVTTQRHEGPNGGPIVGVQLQVQERDLSERAKMLLAKRVTPQLTGQEMDFLS